MLAIRMQRTGRSGHAQFRVIVQDSHRHPTRGKIVAYIGSYNPHTKTAEIDKELASRYLGNGAQPSDRVAKLLKDQGVKLPDWVSLSTPKKRSVRNPDKRRSTRPAEAEAPVVAAEEAVPEVAVEQPAEAAEPEAPAKEEAPAATEETQPTETEPATEDSPASEGSTPAEAAETPEGPATTKATESAEPDQPAA